MAAGEIPTETEPSRGVVVWITGLPAAGKSTFSRRARTLLQRARVAVCVLDGDEVRDALVPRPGYTAEARAAFYETLARLAALLARQGLVVLVPATAHRAEYRAEARRLAPLYLEVWVQADELTVRGRDPKGLYAAAAAGRVADVPGVDARYEAPTHADVVAEGGQDQAALERLVERIHGAHRSGHVPPTA
jgi:adenylylsulfate kinase